MSVLVWITESTWPACVDAALGRVLDSEDLVLLQVADERTAAAARSSREVLDAAADRLGRPAERRTVRGRPQHSVIAAAKSADLLICARDGKQDELGPGSLTTATRSVVEHAPCPVLLVWPGEVPDEPPAAVRAPEHSAASPAEPG